jgi:hypothetical protein
VLEKLLWISNIARIIVWNRFNGTIESLNTVHIYDDNIHILLYGAKEEGGFPRPLSICPAHIIYFHVISKITCIDVNKNIGIFVYILCKQSINLTYSYHLNQSSYKPHDLTLLPISNMYIPTILALSASLLPFVQADQYPLNPTPSTIPQPSIGFGTWNLNLSPENTTEAVAYAIEIGYRQIDCAAAYGNEVAVGKGIKEGLKRAGIERGDLWVTSKLWNDW